MALEQIENFDIFLSYNWDVKDKVKLLYNKLTVDLKLKVWIDFNQLDNNMLYDQLTVGIKKSTVFLCCVTKKYTESVNCIREITFASESQKKMIVLMFEKLQINDIGSVGFIISPLTRFNCYDDRNIFNTWSGPIFDSILKSLNNCLKNQSKWENLVANQKSILPFVNMLPKVKGLSSEEKKDKILSLRRSSNADLANKNYSDAINKLNQAIELDPTDKISYLSKAKILNNQSKYEEAIQALTIALNIDPNYDEAKIEKAFSLNEQGNIEYDLEKYNLALIKYTEATKLNPKNKTYYSNKAGALKNLERYEEAIQALDVALILDSEYKTAIEKKASVLNALATLNFQHGNYQLSLIRYEEAIRLNPNEKVFYANKAGVLIKLNRYDDAINSAETSLKMDPKYEFAKEKKKLAESKKSKTQ